jgi:protein TonB
MFEDATFDSTGRIHTRSRSWMLAALALNGSILLALILIPLIYPEALPKQMMNILLLAPPPPAGAPRLPDHPIQRTSRGGNLVVPLLTDIPRRIFIGDDRDQGRGQPIDENGAVELSLGPGVANSVGVFPGAGPIALAPPPKPNGPAHISSGVAEGLLLQRVLPVYPAIARAARMEGTVILQATISKTGTIENLHVLGGPAMLQRAAVDAVRQWRYRPYLLNGEPVEVETTVNVIFRLGQ